MIRHGMTLVFSLMSLFEIYHGFNFICCFVTKTLEAQMLSHSVETDFTLRQSWHLHH